jgi:hypothetical protein
MPSEGQYMLARVAGHLALNVEDEDRSRSTVKHPSSRKMERVKGSKEC